MMNLVVISPTVAASEYNFVNFGKQLCNSGDQFKSNRARREITVYGVRVIFVTSARIVDSDYNWFRGLQFKAIVASEYCFSYTEIQIPKLLRAARIEANQLSVVGDSQILETIAEILNEMVEKL